LQINILSAAVSAINVAGIGYSALAGIAATLTMDVLGRLAVRLGWIRGAKSEWIGRWYIGMLRGVFSHSDIRQAGSAANEKQVALAGHYLIGIALAVVYFVLATWMRLDPAGPLPAIGFGIATSVFPLGLVYPALGFGWLGSRSPAGLRPVTTSLWNHFAYGLGLWWSFALTAMLVGF
jgi:hypothetical protein